MLGRILEHAEYFIARQFFSIHAINGFQERVECVSEVGDSGEGSQVYWHLTVWNEELGEHQHWNVCCWNHE